MIHKILAELNRGGPRGLARAVHQRLFPFRLKALRSHSACFAGKAGLEIGGPSVMFNDDGPFPVYGLVRSLDNCNFASHTVWEGQIDSGATFCPPAARHTGIQYVAEATDLGPLPSSSYDFVLSSHALEHSANALKALAEWIRVLKDDGVLVLVLPHKDGTFDHRRPVTSLQHLIRDFEDDVTEGDLTHVEEILALHDLSMDPAAGTLDAFRQRSLRNVENRCLHHHVFDTALVVDMVDHMKLQILAVEAFKPCNIMVMARKCAPSTRPANARFSVSAPVRAWRSPFRSDQRRRPAAA